MEERGLGLVGLEQEFVAGLNKQAVHYTISQVGMVSEGRIIVWVSGESMLQVETLGICRMGCQLSLIRLRLRAL